MPFGYAKNHNERAGTSLSNKKASNTVPTGRGKSPLNSNGQWCAPAPSFDRPPGNAGWGAMPSVPGSSGDHNGNWRSQPVHSSSSGWGPPSTWFHVGAPVGPTAGTPYQTRPPSNNMYLPDHDGWAPPSHPPGATDGWDSSLMQPWRGTAKWENASPFYGTSAPPYHTQDPPVSRYPPRASATSWPTEASFQMPHQPAAAPVASHHGRRTPEPAIGAGPPVMFPPSGPYTPHPRPPATVLPDPGPASAAEASQKRAPPQRLATDTRVVCGPLSRLAALPADPRRWLVLLARLEEPPAAGGPSRRFTVREPDGTRTECIYYELERPLPALEPGKWVRCVGRLDGRGVFVCVTARPAARQDIGLHRQLQQLALQPTAAADADK